MAGLGNALVGNGYGGLHENGTVTVVGARNHAEQILALGNGLGRGMEEMVDVLPLSVKHFGFIDDGVHQAEIFGFVGGEAAARQHQFLGGGVPDFGHHKWRNRGWRDAQAHLRKSELGSLFRNHDVGGGDDAVGPADASPMNAHDDRFVAEINRLEEFGEPLCVGDVLVVAEARHILHVGQVGTGAEALPVAFQDDDADVVAAV